MKKLLTSLLISLTLITLTGCVNTTGRVYSPSTNNVIMMQNLLSAKNEKIKLEAFKESASIGDLVCRFGAPIDVAAGKTRAKYIFDAMQTELFMANAYDVNSDIEISGELIAISFSSVSPAYWNMVFKVSSNKSKGYVVRTKYSFQTSYDGKKACQNVADAFAPAVQKLIQDVITNSKFPELLG